MATVILQSRVGSTRLRHTVDYPEDFQRVSRIIQHLYQEKIPGFSDILAFAREEQPG